jgi:hypothetical protein
MRTEKQSAASRINGAKSRGPKTPQGRATSAMNASQHGITTRTVTLNNESKDRFLEMMNAYFDLFQPSNQMEIDLVCDIVAARWRLRRIWHYQTAMLDVEMDVQAPAFEKRYETIDEDVRGAEAFSAIVDKSKGYATALRTDVHLNRIYRRALEDLRRLRGGNILNETPIFQNEPEGPDVSPVDSINTASEISTEPEEPAA